VDKTTTDQPASGAKTTRETKKQLALLERRLARLKDEELSVMAALAKTDPTDYTALSELTTQLNALDQATAAAEDQWLELSEAAGF